MARAMRLPTFSCRLDEMPVCEVRVTRRRPMPPMSEQLADERQVLAGHDGMAGHRMPKVVNAKRAESGVRADRPPAKPKRVLPLGITRKQEAIRISIFGQRVD